VSLTPVTRIDRVLSPLVVLKWCFFVIRCDFTRVDRCSVDAPIVITDSPVLSSVVDSSAFSKPH